MAALNDKVPGISLRDVGTFVVSSASVGNTFAYLSERERHIGRKMWTEELTSEKFILKPPLRRLLRGEMVVDVDYLVDVVFKQRYPFSIERIGEAKESVYFPLLNVDRGEIEFFSTSSEAPPFVVRNGKQVPIHRVRLDGNLYEVIRAAKAVPFLYNKVITINGARYVDGGIREPLTLDIPEAKGSKRIIIVSRQHGTLAEFLMLLSQGAFLYVFCIICKRSSLERGTARDIIVRAFTYRRLMKEVRELVRRGEAILLEPTVKLGGILDNSPKTMAQNYLAGENEVLRRSDEIVSFVKDTMLRP